MNRREVFAVGAATTVAHLVTTLGGCAAQNAAAGASTVAQPAAGGGGVALLQTASDCVRAGEACLSHCLRSLSTGSTMMAECAARVRVMLALCRAVESLATTGSAHLTALARICADACAECAAACGPHAGHHAECAACERACRAMAEAARAAAG